MSSNTLTIAEKPILTKSEAAMLLGVCELTLVRWGVPMHKPGGQKIVIYRAELDEFIKSKKGEGK